MENAIRNLINFAKKSSGSHRRIVLSSVTEKQLETYKRKGISDIDSDFVHSMGSSSLIHYVHQHKNDNRGQMPLTNEEMVNIIDVIKDFDEVEKGGLTNTGLNTILYKKDMGDGTIVYVEEVRTGRKSLAFKTAYKKKKGIDSSDGLLPNGHPQTSKTTPDNLNSDNKDTDNSSNEQGNGGNNSQANEKGGGRATFMVSSERDADYMDAVEKGDADDEAHEIERKAKANGIWLKAPNGKPSRLSPKHWVLVRTKRFKDWFGDWEIAARMNEAKQIHPIDLRQYKLFGTPEETYMSFGTATNKRDNIIVKFDHEAFKKNYKVGGKFEAVIPALKDIFEESILVLSESDNVAGTKRKDGTTHKVHRNFKEYRQYIGKAIIDGQEE